ncbi:MAG TPA: DUF1080 domain-containing protein [Verrucomicrobiae bacterium]|jgi:hypothetical protein|nr:DUF1080 domain-containing protein [Verrucomicrobiae bacterium]
MNSPHLPSKHRLVLDNSRALLLSSLVFCVAGAARAADLEPGFTAIFDGRTLDGWWGASTEDPRGWMALPPDEFKKKHDASLDDIRQHWHVDNGELVSDGGGLYLTTEKNYGDIDLVVDYKTVPLADSGIYLKGCPQVQIWDHTNPKEFKNGAQKGSGGLWNNSPGAPGKDPLELADKPFGEWNHFRIRQLGSRTTVLFNEQLVVDNAILENYFNRKLPIPPVGPIQLQTHGGEIRWRNMAVREIPTDEANHLLRGQDPEGFDPIFNGKDFDGWAGPLDCCKVEDGAIVWQRGKGGTPYYKANYTNFIVRLEFKLPPGGNNGLAIRYPGEGDTAYVGMCECQVLDDNYEKATGDKIDPRQAHGSAYGMVAAARGYQRPIGEWNYEEVTVIGPKMKVELNGSIILDCDLSKVTEFLDGKSHPGKNRKSGHFGLAGHDDPVMFRNLSIKRLP